MIALINLASPRDVSGLFRNEYRINPGGGGSWSGGYVDVESRYGFPDNRRIREDKIRAGINKNILMRRNQK